MEIWKEFNGYKVSNYGKIVNRFGKKVKGYIQKDRGYTYKVVVLRINKTRKLFHLNTLIFKLFNDNYVENARVFYVNGDIENCNIFNLKISRAYTTKPTVEQIDIYEKNVIACVKDYFKKQGWIKINNGFDVDNAICETYLYVYKYLSTYKVGTSFYSFCARYSRIVFAVEYKKFKQEKLYYFKIY